MTPKKTEQKNLERRPPIAVIMGHVDHGKTTLLDYIRNTNVALREAGGITQSIGAYEIEHAGQKITFIDTPGHEAFSKMRARGARIADLAILLVAADDGVKPQTKDALKYILAEKVPFVVAINKIDKMGADIDKVINELMQLGVYLEGRGGNVSWCAISAKTGEGISSLLDLLLLASEFEDIHCTGDHVSSGVVISVKSDAKRGVMTSVIVKNGAIEQGAMIATHTATGKVKILENYLGKTVKEIISSAPAIIFGFDNSPKVGEVFCAHKDEKILRASLEKFERERQEVTKSLIAEDDLSKRVPIFLKADELGSLEVLKDTIESLVTTLPIIVVKASVGVITENDAKDAEGMKATIIGFHTKIDKAAQNIRETKKINIITSDIIYELVDALTEYAKNAIEKENRSLEILGVFGQPKGKERVIGGRVLCGPISRNESFEVWHGTRKIGEGRILNLQSNKIDITEAEKDTEVGMLVECESDIKIGNYLIFLD